jgi:NADH-quinone oxidoreductase subunit G
LLEIPAGTNGRGLREAGVLPNAGPGLSERPDAASGEAGSRDARGIANGLLEGELAAVLLVQSDPLSTDRPRAAVHDEPPLADGRSLHDGSADDDLPDGDPANVELWGQALERASTVVAYATFLTDGLRTHANVVFPAQAYAEKEGTIVHPDGRIQRLRPAVANPGAIRAQWQTIADLAAGIGLDLGVQTGAMASQRLFDAVSFYSGLTLEEIGGTGVRWQQRPAAEAYPTREQLV